MLRADARDRPIYVEPSTDELTEDHVRQALDFLVVIEPVPMAASSEEYQAAIAPYRLEVAEAITTMRRFVAQTTPMTLQQMQDEYYGFTNDPRYRTSQEVSSVVASALNQAWHGIGPWRR